MRKQITTIHDVGTGSSFLITDQVGMDFDVGRGPGDEMETSSRYGNDIIFAYQLHVIAVKVRRTRTTNVNVYAPKAAFLHNGAEADIDAGLSAS